MLNLLPKLAAIAGAGALGTLARYGLSGLAHQWFGAGFAWGTLAVNLIGCLAIGLLMQPVLEGGVVPQPWRLAVVVGFCGAFTTFSAFGHETLGYLREGTYLLAVGNVLANVILGLLCVWAGFALMRLLAGGM